jgi:hypothetical protein
MPSLSPADAGAEGEMTQQTPHDRQTPPVPRPLEPARPQAAPRPARGLGAGGPAGGGLMAGLAAGRPQLRPATSSWARTWQWVVAGGVTVLLAWLTYSRGGWIPVLSAFDLGVHEFGHLLTAWAPALLCSLAGSFLQVALPLLLGGYFWWRRDHLAVILMVAWAAENLHNVSVYIADAQVMILPLFGDDGSGAGHDWHNILVALNALEATDQLALVVKTGSVILFIVALGLAALGFSRSRRA